MSIRLACRFLLIALAYVRLAPQVAAQEAKPAKPYGIEVRIPLTTSKVVGAPDPPPPYLAEKAFPELKLSLPITVRHQPGSDRLMIINQLRAGDASLLRMQDDPAATEVETLLTVKGALYDVIFHPRFADNGFLYVGGNYAGDPPADNSDADEKPVKLTRVTRYRMDPNPPYAFDAATATTIIEWNSNGHNGGAMAFGNDGMFYVTSGDGTSDSDTDVAGQDMTKLTAKLLRIDLEHPDEGRQYSVPKDNPFVDVPDIRPETWAYGFRNPWRMTCDPKTGHIWVGNNGQDLWEQAFFVRKGDNFGWSVMEGGHEFYLERKPGPTPFVKPALEHSHAEARSLTGGVVYYGQMLPELSGAYIYGDYSTGKIWGARHDGEKVTWHKELADTSLAITCFCLDSRGELLIVDHRGEGLGNFYRLVPRPAPVAPPPPFPRLLSETGLFQSVAGHVVQPALIPYSVNAPFWSDGAYKERHMALPENGDAPPQIVNGAGKGWTFPDETVIVKSFALQLDDRDPASRRWIETRLLTKQAGEWVGYSYQWNDEQTDAALVASPGKDQTFSRTHANPAGERENYVQSWHYPSRAECMVCHSRAANYVLGLCTSQMNKDHDYGERSDNQLRTLAHLGLLKTSPVDDAKATVRKRAKDAGLSDEELKKQLAEFSPARLKEIGEDQMLQLALGRIDCLVDPHDAQADITARVRSYLHSNCANCHIGAGGGNAQFDVGFSKSLSETKLVDVKPVHHTYNLPDARLVASGHPERSVLLHRLTHRTAGHMPPLSTSVVDDQAVKLLRDWIASLSPSIVDAEN